MMEDQQRNPTDPEHTGIEMTNSEQPTKQVGSFPERAERSSTSSQTSTREQSGHQVAKYIPPTRDAMTGIDIRSRIHRCPEASASGQGDTQLPEPSRGIYKSGIHRSPAASASGQGDTQLPEPSRGIYKRSGILRFPAASASGQSDTQLPEPSLGIYKRSGIYRSPAASASGQSTAQLPPPSRGIDRRSGREVDKKSRKGGMNFDDIELTSAEYYFLLRHERKYVTKILKSTKNSDIDTETEARKLRPGDYRTPPELDTDDQNEDCCGTVSLVLIMCSLSSLFFGLFVLVGLYTYYKIPD